MDGVAALENVEVVEEGAVVVAGLGAYSGVGWGEVAGLDLGDEFLEGLGEGGFAEGAVDFGVSVFPIFAGKGPETGPCEGFGKVAWVYVAPCVAFAGEGEDSVWSGFDAAADHAGEVYAEEGKGGVGNGVDEVFDEVLFLGS